MTTNELRDALRTLQVKGRIQHFTELGVGTFLVNIGPGPTVRVSNKRGWDALSDILMRKAAGVR